MSVSRGKAYRSDGDDNVDLGGRAARQAGDKVLLALLVAGCGGSSGRSCCSVHRVSVCACVFGSRWGEKVAGLGGMCLGLGGVRDGYWGRRDVRHCIGTSMYSVSAMCPDAPRPSPKTPSWTPNGAGQIDKGPTARDVGQSRLPGTNHVSSTRLVSGQVGSWEMRFLPTTNHNVALTNESVTHKNTLMLALSSPRAPGLTLGSRRCTTPSALGDPQYLRRGCIYFEIPAA